MLRAGDGSRSGYGATHWVRKNFGALAIGIEYGLVAPPTSDQGPRTLFALSSLAVPVAGCAHVTTMLLPDAAMVNGGVAT